MDPIHFCYWLRGVLELGERALTKEEVEVISKHLSTVFIEKAKDTPPVSKAAKDGWHQLLDPQFREEQRKLLEEELKKFPLDPRDQVFCALVPIAPASAEPTSVEGSPTFVSELCQSIAEATEAMKEWGVHEETSNLRGPLTC